MVLPGQDLDVDRYVIDEKGKIAGIWPKVKPDGHAEQILAAIEG